jgi:hypothetical protein
LRCVATKAGEAMPSVAKRARMGSKAYLTLRGIARLSVSR